MLQFLNIYSGAELFIVLVAYLLVLLLALSLHEFAHAYMAVKQGDFTPKAQGRLTINPLAHIDPLGFVMLLIVGFGWAKPVQVNPLSFRNYKKGSTLVALAGVTMNFILAFVSYPFMLLTEMFQTTMPYNLYLFLNIFFQMMVIINLVLVVFNLLPIYPLDGFRLVETYAKYNNKYVQFMRKNGSFVLLIMLVVLQIFDVLSYLVLILSLPIGLFWNFIFGLF